MPNANELYLQLTSHLNTPYPMVFQVDPTKGPKIRVQQVFWTVEAKSAFAEILREAGKSDNPAGNMLPYTGLRALLQVNISAANFIAGDLGAPWKRSDKESLYPFMEVGADIDMKKELLHSIGLWMVHGLSKWAEALDIPAGELDALQDCIDNNTMFIVKTVDVPHEVTSTLYGNDFRTMASGILQEAGNRLAGKVLFDGMGPLYRTVRPNQLSNKLDLVTWPVEAKKGRRTALYSMRLRLSVETMPYSALPVVTMRVSRIRWIAKPIKYELSRSRTGYLMKKGEKIAALFQVPTKGRELQSPDDLLFLHTALKWEVKTWADPAVMAYTELPREDYFISIPYAPNSGDSHPIGSGASDADHLDAYRVVAETLGDLGWKAVAFRSVKYEAARKTDPYLLVGLKDQLADYARDVGKNYIDNDTLKAVSPEFLQLISLEILDKDLNTKKDRLDGVRERNTDNVRQAFANDRPSVVIVAKTEEARTRLRNSIKRLFGTAVTLHEYALPANTHGPASDLTVNGKRMRPAERFERRVEAWKDLTTTIKENHPDAHVLVEADRIFAQHQKDDPVAKAAGRYAIAKHAEANVQYILPLEGAGTEAGTTIEAVRSFLIRTQMSMYDLLYGHSGLVLNVKEGVDLAFEDVANKPKSIIGISVIAQARSRKIGGSAGKICVATMLDLANGQTYGKVAVRQGNDAVWTRDWKSFHQLLKMIADMPLPSIGSDDEQAKDTFQKFARHVLDEAQGDGASLVLVDSTSAQGLWPWLNDANIENGIYFGSNRVDLSNNWPDVRIVRIRKKNAAPIIRDKSASYRQVDLTTKKPVGDLVKIANATMSVQVTEMTSNGKSGAHYWATSTFPTQSKPKRGMSVYRDRLLLSNPPQEVKNQLAGTDEFDLRKVQVMNLWTPFLNDYRLPSTIDITIAKASPADNFDLIACLIQHLRQGYAHSNDDTTLPAPLFFETKVRDYMVRFSVAEAETDEDQTKPDGSPEDDLDAGPSGDDGDKSEEDRDDDILSFVDSMFDDTAMGKPQAQAKPHSFGAIGQREADIPHDRDTLFSSASVLSTASSSTNGHFVFTSDDTSDDVESVDLRQPLLPVPSHINVEWALKFLKLPNSNKRILHRKFKDFICEYSGFNGWTSDIPTEQQMAEILVSGLRYPLFLSALNGSCYEISYSYKTLPFKPLFDGFTREALPVLSRAERSGLTYQWQFLKYASKLTNAKHKDMLRDICFVTAVAHGINDIDDEIMRHPEICAEIMPAIQAMRRLKMTALGKPLSSAYQSFKANGSILPKEDRKAYGAPSVDSPDAGPAMEVGDQSSTSPLPMSADQPMVGSAPSSSETTPDEAWIKEEIKAIREQNINETLALEAPAGSPDDSRTWYGIWNTTLFQIGEHTSLMTNDEPNTQELAKLRDLINILEEAAAKFHATKPKFIDTAPFYDFAERVENIIVSALAGLGKSDPLEGSDIDRVKVGMKMLKGISFITPEAAADAMPLQGYFWELEQNLANIKSNIEAIHSDSIKDSTANTFAMMMAFSAKIAPFQSSAVDLINEGYFYLAEYLDCVIKGNVNAASEASTDGEIEEADEAGSSALNADSLDGVMVQSPEDTTPEEASGVVLESDDIGGEEVPASANPDTLIASLDEAIKAAETLAQATTQERVAVAEPETVIDPFVDQISTKLREFAIFGQYGIAHHLARAAEKFMPDAQFAYTSSEMKLAAIAGRVNFASGQHSKMLLGLVSDVLPMTRTEYGEGNNSHTIARRLIIFGAALEMGLLDTSTGALQLLDTAIDPEVDRQAHFLKERLTDLTFQNAQANLELFKNLSVVNEVRENDTALLKKVADKARQLEGLTVRFAPARAVIKHLAMHDKPIGQLIIGLQKPETALDACQVFYDQLGLRERVYQLIDRTEAEIHSKSTTIDGIARERVIGHILELSGLCKEVIDRAKAATSLNSKSYRDKMSGLVDRSLQQIGHVKSVIAKLVGDNGPEEVKAAADFASFHLDRLAEVIRGRSAPVDNMAHLYAVHGPIMLIDGLRFGTSWLPSPYDPQQIVTAILQHDAKPNPEHAFLTPDAFEEAARRHIASGGILAATRLVLLSRQTSVTRDSTAHIMNLIEAQKSGIRATVSSQLEGVKRVLENIERQAERLSEQEAASEQLTKLEHIDIASLPVELTSLEDLTEDETGDQISDFADVRVMLADVNRRAENITANKRAELRAELDRLIAENRISPDYAREINSVIDSNDVVTSHEYLEYVKKGEALPSGPEETKRFNEFYPDAPQSFGGDQKSSRVASAITDGTDFGQIKFSRVPETRRQENAEIWNAWQELRTKTIGGSGTEIVDLLAKFLNKAEYRASVTEAKAKPDGARFDGVLSVILPLTADTNILPDFGSELRGRYTVGVTNKRPTESDITAFMAGAAQEGRILFVTDAIPVADRAKIAGWCRKEQFRLLIIDDAILAYTLSEEQYRPMTMMELAQPFAYASPYRDYTDLPVPPEMFYGRSAEIKSLLEAMGSCVVYGGRRLGKSAMLKHIVGQYHNPSARFICAQVNIFGIGKDEPLDNLWRRISAAMPDVFENKVPNADQFFDRINDWMEEDDAGRILLMLDETETMIEADAQQSYQIFLRFSGLMTSTNRRFKVVFAGLKNVTRLARSGNPPLRHIASNPIQVGPLMQKELGEAERLVTRPLAALGFQFQERGLVWRILSKANYYPIMVQVFCENLLKIMRRRNVKPRGEPPFIITAEDVHNAMADDALNKAIETKFEDTLTGVTHIYKLIACLIADRIYQNRAEGKIDDGMSAVEIRRGAVKYCPATANMADGLAVIEDLLDEMQGMGLIRQTASRNWTLRSPSIMRHLKSWDDVHQYLNEYASSHEVDEYDPRRLRRLLKPGVSLHVADGHPAPLTQGQEFQILDNPERVTVVFGSKASDVDLVAPSLHMENYMDDPDTLISEVSTGQFDAVKAQVSKLVRIRDYKKRILFVTPVSAWNSGWVKEVLRLNAVKNDEVRIVFVGTDKHAARWVGDKDKIPAQHIREMSLSAWSHGMLNDIGRRLDLSVDRYRRRFMEGSGALNHFMADAMIALRHSGGQEAAMVRWTENILGDERNLDKIGASNEILRHFRSMLAYDLEVATQDDILAAAFSDQENGMTVEEFIRYGELMNLLKPEIPEPPEKGEPVSSVTKWRMNPLLISLIKKHKAA